MRDAARTRALPQLQRPSRMTHKINSRPSSRGGVGLFVDSKIAPGQLIVNIPEPLVTVPDDAHLKECCSRCMVWKPENGIPSGSMLNPYRDASPLSFCTGCRVVKYCSKDCQRDDWKVAHKHECELFKGLNPRILPASVRATIRMLFTSPGDVWNQIRRLESHEREYKMSPKRWESINLMAKGAHAYSRTMLGEKEVRGLYCRLMLNSITLVTPTFDPVGIAFDLFASLINHSCDPNSVMVFNGRALSVRALREIAIDEEVTISYIDNSNPTYKRKEELKERYFFDCECLRCASSGKNEDPREAFACVSPECDGLISGQIVGGSESEEDCGKCRKCNTAMPFTSQELERLENDGWLAVAGTFASTEEGKRDYVINALKNLHESKVWPIQHQPIPALHYELVHTVYIPASSWPQALMHSLIQVLFVDPIFYPQRHHPVRVVHAFTLASLFLQVSRDPSSLAQEFPRAKGLDLDYGKIIWGLLCEVVAHVVMSHGPNSSFTETVGRKMEELENDLKASEITKVWVGKKVNEIGLEGELVKIGGLVNGLLEDLRATKSS